MNKSTKLTHGLLITLLALTLPFGYGMAQVEGNDEGDLWQVTAVEGTPDPELVLVDDTFRLKFMAQERKAMIKPLPPLRDRWGQSATYKATLDRQGDQPLYCGTIKYLGKGPHENEDHPLSISVVDPDFVILDFNGCSYHESHGGVAHAHR